MTDKARDRGQTTYLLEAANGMLVRVPADKLASWQRAQAEIKAGTAKLTKEEELLKEKIVSAILGRKG